jgi:hypothetical protein
MTWSHHRLEREREREGILGQAIRRALNPAAHVPEFGLSDFGDFSPSDAIVAGVVAFQGSP